MRRLYFVARDGYLTWKAARILTPQFGDIDCRYLKISRQSVLLPSASRPTSADMPWVRLPWEHAELKTLVRRVGLIWSDVDTAFSRSPILKEASNILRTEEDWCDFWAHLQKPPLLPLIQNQILNQRATTTAYLQAEGLFDSTPAAIVDIGWLLMSQMAIRNLVRWGGASDAFLGGYYLGAKIGRLHLSQTGQIRSLFFEKARDITSLTGDYELFNRVDPLEQLLGFAPHGSVMQYCVDGSTVEPICEPTSDEYVALVKQVTFSVESFCAEHGGEASQYAEDNTARELLDALISTWFRSPGKAAVNVLAKLRGPNSQKNDSHSQVLVDRWKLWDAIANFVPVRWRKTLRIKLRSRLWPEASLLESNWLPARLVQLQAKLFGALKNFK